ncbi:hypothetical protein E7745_06280 [Duncaniella sp. C9]|nr:hypothetical protein E7745_06280 [Duncaniella sp. C9]QCP72858.1 hypothetical protein FDZ78_09985 [Duncaniella sp. B8]
MPASIFSFSKLSDIPFTAIDRSFIDKYDIYLRTQRRLATSAVDFHTTRLKMIVSEATRLFLLLCYY